MGIDKTIKRHGGYADLGQSTIALWHLIKNQFPFIDFLNKMISLQGIPSILTGKNAEIVVQGEGEVIGQRRQINFIAGTGIQITVADDPTNNRINITITATGGIIPD
jgi:hypothetical protein